jgi:heme-degrading monooxygenase HmoA
MFARHVSFRLKPNSVAEVTQTLEKEVLPLLRKQKGFQDEITLLAPGGREAVGISLWDQKESAEAYERSAYAEVQKTMGKVIEGTPQVKTYEVSTSTIHKMTARGTA